MKESQESQKAKELVEEFFNGDENLPQACDSEVQLVKSEENEYLCITCEWLGSDIVQSLRELGFELKNFENDGRYATYSEFKREK